jgi:hypothetical protein
VLVERHSFLGGNATAALVMPLMASIPAIRRGGSARIPSAHRSRPGRSGHRQRAAHFWPPGGTGGALASSETGYTVPFDPEQFKLTALECSTRPASFPVHAFASGVLAGTLRGRGVRDQAGPRWCARMIVGAPAAATPRQVRLTDRRDADGLVQPMTLMFHMADFGVPHSSHHRPRISGAACTACGT